MKVALVFVPILALVAAVLLHATSLEDLQPYESPITGVGLPPMAVFRLATKVSSFIDGIAFSLKPPTAQLMMMLNGYQVTQALSAFASLHLADAINKLATADSALVHVDAIAKEAMVDAEALRRLLRMLAALNLVKSEGGSPSAERFGLTPATALLAKDATGSLWGAAVISGADHYDGWKNLAASLRKGADTIAFDDRFGLSIWEHYKKEPYYEKAFADFMTGISAEPNAAIAASGVNFTMCGGLVDVGGGHGSLMAEVVAAFPTLKHKATVLDLPSVAKSAPPIDGVSFKGGDFFDGKALPRSTTTNCYIAKVVLHDWSSVKAVEILKGVGHAMELAQVPMAARRMYLAEQVLTENDALGVPKLGLDMNMMVMCGGGERTLGEWKALLAEAGWVLSQVYETRSLFTVMEAVPATS